MFFNIIGFSMTLFEIKDLIFGSSFEKEFS
jgi:hypothetical protein